MCLCSQCTGRDQTSVAMPLTNYRRAYEVTRGVEDYLRRQRDAYLQALINADVPIPHVPVEAPPREGKRETA